jgi:hypothetical protein
MILWQLQGAIRDVVCSIQKQRNGYRLLVIRGRSVEYDETMPNVTFALARARVLREQLIAMGFTSGA